MVNLFIYIYFKGKLWYSKVLLYAQHFVTQLGRECQQGLFSGRPPTGRCFVNSIQHLDLQQFVHFS